MHGIVSSLLVASVRDFTKKGGLCGESLSFTACAPKSNICIEGCQLEIQELKGEAMIVSLKCPVCGRSVSRNTLSCQFMSAIIDSELIFGR
jgi:hypothetical protein